MPARSRAGDGDTCGILNLWVRRVQLFGLDTDGDVNRDVLRVALHRE